MTQTAPRIDIAARYPGNRTFRQVLEEIRDVYDARSELFTGGDDCAANLADRARLALDAARPEVEAARQAVIEAARSLKRCTYLAAPMHDAIDTIFHAVRALEKLEAEHAA